MKQYNKQIIVMFSAIAVIAYMSIQFFPKQQNKEIVKVMDEVKEDAIQIYVLDQDKMVLPLTKSIKPGMKLEDKITQVIQQMCEGQVKKPFQALLNKDTKLEKITIENKKAKLHFNEAFATYHKQHELQVLEAITWAMTQFQEIDSIELYVKQSKLTHMPKANTPIQDPLTRAIGINHFESTTTRLHNSDTITVFYTKNIENETYFVPKSKRMEGSKDNMELVVKEVLKNISASSTLSSPLFEDNIDTMDLPRRENDKLIVNMSNALLESDRSAKPHAYESLVLSLAHNFDVDEVMVYVEDQVVSLHGSNEEVLHVSSLQYNEIPF